MCFEMTYFHDSYWVETHFLPNGGLVDVIQGWRRKPTESQRILLAHPPHLPPNVRLSQFHFVDRKSFHVHLHVWYVHQVGILIPGDDGDDGRPSAPQVFTGVQNLTFCWVDATSWLEPLG